MLLTQSVSIYISRRNIKYYKEKGYDVYIFNYHNISIIDLPLYCKSIVNCKCDICDKEREMSYFEYKRYNDNYTCRQCSEYKRQITSMKNWGVDNPSKNDIIKRKISNTLKAKLNLLK
jgi:hypothetical protein